MCHVYTFYTSITCLAKRNARVSSSIYTYRKHINTFHHPHRFQINWNVFSHFFSQIKKNLPHTQSMDFDNTKRVRASLCSGWDKITVRRRQHTQQDMRVCTIYINTYTHKKNFSKIYLPKKNCFFPWQILCVYIFLKIGLGGGCNVLSVHALPLLRHTHIC